MIQGRWGNDGSRLCLISVFAARHADLGMRAREPVEYPGCYNKAQSLNRQRDDGG